MKKEDAMVTRWKEKLLGGTKTPSASEPIPPNTKELQAPFETEGAVMYAWCTGCGARYELKPDGAAALFAELDQPYSVEPGTYFELGACGTCHGDRVGVELKRM